MTRAESSTAGEPAQVLGAGKMAEVVAHGDHALKLYYAGGKQQAFNEGSVLALLEAHGVPAPRVERVAQFEGRWGVLMTRARGRAFADAVLEAPHEVPRYLAALAELHRQMHACIVPGLGSLKSRLAARVGGAGQLAEGVRARLLDRLTALPDGDRLCHGDFHPYNVLGEPGNATIVDWPDAATGAPAADLCRSYLLISQHSPDYARAYVDAYLAGGSAFGPDEVFAWLPVLAAARLAENVPEETERLVALAGG